MLGDDPRGDPKEAARQARQSTRAATRRKRLIPTQRPEGSDAATQQLSSAGDPEGSDTQSRRGGRNNKPELLRPPESRTKVTRRPGGSDAADAVMTQHKRPVGGGARVKAATRRKRRQRPTRRPEGSDAAKQQLPSAGDPKEATRKADAAGTTTSQNRCAHQNPGRKSRSDPEEATRQTWS